MRSDRGAHGRARSSIRRGVSTRARVVSDSQFSPRRRRSRRRGRPSMDIAARLERDLEETTARLRHDVNLALLEDGEYSVSDVRAIVDEVDGAQRSIEREMTLVA